MMDSNENAKISIVMPVYNAAPYLPRTLSSILNQTFTAFEVIAVDDKSTDNSLQILEEYAKKDSRIKVFRNEKNLGVSRTSNIGIKLASAMLIARMDADDLMPKERLALQYQFFEEHPDYVLLGGQVRMIDAQDAVIETKVFPVDQTVIYNSLFLFNSFQQGTLMINRQKVPADFSWYDEEILIAEDLDLVFRLIQYGPSANLNQVLLDYRMVHNSLSRRSIKETFRWIYNIRKKAITQYGFRPPFIYRVINQVQKIIVSIFPDRFIEMLFFISKKIIHHKAIN